MALLLFVHYAYPNDIPRYNVGARKHIHKRGHIHLPVFIPHKLNRTLPELDVKEDNEHILSGV